MVNPFINQSILNPTNTYQRRVPENQKNQRKPSAHDNICTIMYSHVLLDIHPTREEHSVEKKAKHCWKCQTMWPHGKVKQKFHPKLCAYVVGVMMLHIVACSFVSCITKCLRQALRCAKSINKLKCPGQLGRNLSDEGSQVINVTFSVPPPDVKLSECLSSTKSYANPDQKLSQAFTWF